ncbi:hypothetical protein WJX79_002866 [Trebouxia sp. C0005]
MPSIPCRIHKLLSYRCNGCREQGWKLVPVDPSHSTKVTVFEHKVQPYSVSTLVLQPENRTSNLLQCLSVVADMS